MSTSMVQAAPWFGIVVNGRESVAVLYECGCGARTVLSNAGGTLTECDCSTAAKGLTYRRSPLFAGDSELVSEAIGPPVG